MKRKCWILDWMEKTEDANSFAFYLFLLVDIVAVIVRVSIITMLNSNILFGIYFLGAGVISSESMRSFGFGV